MVTSNLTKLLGFCKSKTFKNRVKNRVVTFLSFSESAQQCKT